MRKHLMGASVLAAVFIPTFAFAQQSCEQRRSDQRTTATVVGGIAGALLGNAVSSHGGKTGGTIIGGVAGAAVGNQLGRSHADCSRAYGYYDSNGYWHANAIAASDAAGYYDRSGNWVEGAPTGYYDRNGTWVRTDVSADSSGYRDANGRWVPASAQGYYDSEGQWVAGAASGYYSENGQWVAGPAQGHYDANGRWIRGEALGHRDADGRWIADPQPGHWDSDGRWHPGQAVGYYDGRGRWVSTSDTGTVQVISNGPVPNPESMGDHRHGAWNGDRSDTLTREAWLDSRIRQDASNGSLSRRQARSALRTLNAIRQDDQSMRGRDGSLNERAQARIQLRLDRLARSVHADSTADAS